MNIFHKFRKAEHKQDVIGNDMALFNIGQPVWTPRNYAALAKTGYSLNAVAYKAVREVANGCATVPIKVCKNGIEIKNHPLTKILRKPNRNQSGYEFLYSVYAYLLIAGNSYIQTAFNQAGGKGNIPDGDPVALFTLRPDRMRIIPGVDGYPAAYEHSVNGQNKRFMVNNRLLRTSVLHIADFNPLNDWYGQSSLEPALFHIDIFNSSSQFNKSLLDNGARLTTLLKFQDNLTDKQRESLRSQFLRSFTGAKNAGKPVFLEGGIEAQELGVQPKDMEFMEANLMAARMIALTIGLPPFMLGLPGDNTFNNMREARLHFYLNTIKPMVTHVLMELETYLAPFFDEPFELAPNWDEVEALAPLREKRWERISKADFLTTDEKRVALGYAPLEE